MAVTVQVALGIHGERALGSTLLCCNEERGIEDGVSKCNVLCCVCVCAVLCSVCVYVCVCVGEVSVLHL